MKITVIIPVSNPQQSLLSFVETLEKAGFSSILVADAGSTEGAEILDALRGRTGCKVLRNARTKGRGAALRAAFYYIIKHKGAQDGVIVMEADGRYPAAAAVRCAKVMRTLPETMLLGVRNFGAAYVEPRLHTAAEQTFALLRRHCGVSIVDTQATLRGIPTAMLPALLRVAGRNEDYENNMLLAIPVLALQYRQFPLREACLPAQLEALLQAFAAMQQQITSYAQSESTVREALLLRPAPGAEKEPQAVPAMARAAESAEENLPEEKNAQKAAEPAEESEKATEQSDAAAAEQPQEPSPAQNGAEDAQPQSAAAFFAEGQTVRPAQSDAFFARGDALFANAQPRTAHRAGAEKTARKSRASNGAAKTQAADSRAHKQPGKLTVGRLAGRVGACAGVFLLSIVLAFFGATTVIARGPSPAARDLFVNTVMETSAAKFLARIYFSEEQIQKIISDNTPRQSEEVSDGSGIQLPAAGENFDPSAITVEDVKGGTYAGKMMIVNDPARLFVASVQHFSTEGQGEPLTSMLQRTGAVAGVNGGGFYDPGGLGKGGMPLGIVIQEGKLLTNNPGVLSTVIGFDAQHKLVVGEMTGQQALERGIVEAVSFGPALVINGNRVPITGTGGGLNPRTAIGQREDGAVLLLVIDGRQPHSIGASYKDLEDVMVQYGAVNAANLDGGSSSMLYLNGEMLNKLSFIGERYIPTAFLVH